ncbi:MAG: hypothetical protein FJ264_00430 [Planctomycetes bacterium]|nr:hypothetical protein [Planctomycetota bacterium]
MITVPIIRYLFSLSILPVLFFSKIALSDELLKNGDFETGDVSGWTYWETFPWDGDGIPVKHPASVSIIVPGTIGVPMPAAISGTYSLTQQVSAEGTARGGIYQELNVSINSSYVLTGSMALFGDNTGDTTTIGILDGQWNPSHIFTTPYKYHIGGNTISSWSNFSLSIIPSKNIITVFTETRQDWEHGYVAGWYDNLSLQPIHESNKPFQANKHASEERKEK